MVIQGSSFKVQPGKLEGLLALSENRAELRNLLSTHFSLGGLAKGIFDKSIHLSVEIKVFLEKVMDVSEQHIEVAAGEGYWVDHWTYNMDMIDGYLGVYPECQHDLLFSNTDIPFYDSSVLVQPRSRKYVLVDGQPRQVGSLLEDHEKAALIARRSENNSWLRTGHGTGPIYRTSVFAKLIILAVIKFSTLDPYGMGIEMEAGRPGWYDALNGLPGLFGSSMPEVYALERLVKFLRNVMQTEGSGIVRLPIEVGRLISVVVNEIKRFQTRNINERDYRFWDNVSSAREIYRKTIHLGFDGTEEEFTIERMKGILNLIGAKIKAGIDRALALNNGIQPTYFSYNVDAFDFVKDKKARLQFDMEGRNYICARRLTPRPLPLFLEGIVRAMYGIDTIGAKQIYEKVKKSPLYDRKLKMYRVNASLETLNQEIGRARAFTPGWLENEFIWLHMEYKYLLEVLRAGLYEEFFDDFKTAMVPFFDPNVYGRSPLENSSFLVSSVYPDEFMHGAGFVARLSGATAEFLSMWKLMMAGAEPFFVQDHKLCLVLKPILPAWLFDKDRTVSFKFLGRTTVIYHNPKMRDTFDPQNVIQSIILCSLNGPTLELNGEVIPAPYACQVREGWFRQIDVYFAES